MPLKTTTRRSLSQIIFRHTPESLISLEEYNVFGCVKDIKAEPDTDVNKEILLRKILRYADVWRESSSGRVKGFEPDLRLESIIALRPGHSDPEYPAVFCDIFPPAFQCTRKNCGIYAGFYNTSDFTGTCKQCGGSLRQIKYVWFHPCGRIFPFGPLKDKKCPQHGRDHLFLKDSGRFATSRWQCRKCSYDASLGMIPCSDEQCKTRQTPEESRFMKGSVWNDSWVYYTQQLSFVNLSGSEIDKIIKSPNARQLLLDSLVGRVPAGSSHLGDKADISVKCQKCNAEVPFAAKFCPECGAKQATTSGAQSSNESTESPITADSDLATFASLRDLERTVSIRDSIRHDPNDEKMSALAKQLERNGLSDILLINDFPLTSAAIGYSRFKSSPPAWLNSFPASESMGSKLPVYTNCITSEAWMVQLSARKALDWLELNKLVSDDIKSQTKGLDEAEATIWLTQLLSKESPTDVEARISSLLYDLLHSYSHQVLQLLGTVSGLDAASLGEMLIPQAMSFIIYSGDTDIGGLSASFSQNLSLITQELSDFLRVCKFDPSCLRDDGGVCAGCLYVSRGCSDFNERLSRACLFGGLVGAEKTQISTGFLDILHA